MGDELTAYKQNRISELTSIFNGNVSRLYSALSVNIRNTQNARMSVSAKQAKINTLISQYNTQVATLKSIYDANVASIQRFVPANISFTQEQSATKKALLIGINYVGTQNELYGCINDINAMKERIKGNGFRDNNIVTLTDNTPSKPTKSNILKEFTALLKNARSGDYLFFAYSGHGSYAVDRNGDETTGYDQLIVPLDLNPIVDDDLKTILQANLKAGVTLFAMFDSCFSGSVLDLKYQYMDTLNYDKYTENRREAETSGNVFMISGCSDYQTSADAYINNKSNGAMTWSLLETLKLPNTSGTCSWRELVKSMRDLLKKNNYDQIPQFSCGKFENIDAKVFI